MATTNNNPSTTTSTTTPVARPFTTTPPPPPPPPTRPQTQIPLPYYASMLPQTSQTQTSSPQAHGILYPVSSSGRGFISKPATQNQSPVAAGAAAATAAVAAGYLPRPVAGTTPYSPHRPPPPAIGSPSHHMMRAHPSQFLHHQPHPHLGQTATAGVGSGPIKGIPVTVQPKVAPSPSSAADSNGYKNIRDRGRDDNLFIVRDRKVRITDGSSIYALCRSWLRNGFPEENQQQYGDSTKSLPRPPPIPAADTKLTKEKEGGEAEEHEEGDKESVQHLSAEDLLKGHVKRAKKVRARLREERLKRIARYKTRLALLIPPLVEQFRNDTAAGN